MPQTTIWVPDYPEIGPVGKTHIWGVMKPGTIQGMYSTECQNCGTTIFGSMSHTPTLADLNFQKILQDCDAQLVRLIMES